MDTAFLMLRSIALSALAGAATMFVVLGPLYLLGYTDVFGQALAGVIAIFMSVITVACTFPKPRSDLM